MKKPPQQTESQGNYVSSALRMPSALRDEIKDAGDRNGRSMNAEILARLQAMPLTDRLDRIEKEIGELKALAREALAVLNGN